MCWVKRKAWSFALLAFLWVWYVSIPLPDAVQFQLELAEQGKEDDYIMNTVSSQALPDRVDRSENFHITHLFNTFTTGKRLLSREHTLVQLSWKIAAEHALKTAGIKVEFLDAVLPQDEESVPEFANKYTLKDSILDPFTHHVLPTVGEIFRTGKTHGRGKLVVYTNADIGVMKDFYVNVWKLSMLDPSSPETQKKVFHEALELLEFCLEFDRESNDFSNPTICEADVKTYLKLHGGWMKRYPLIRRDLARSYLRKKVKEYSGKKTPSKQQLAEWYLNAGGSEQHMLQDLSSLKNITAFKVKPQKKSLQKETTATAFTITRLDINVEHERRIPTNEQGLEEILRTGVAQPHPGNDCFVIPRNRIPNMLMNSRHPLSWRPWGMWVPHTFEWEYGPKKVVWRRFESNTQQNYTFHIGVSGRVAQNWISLFNLRPLFLLNLVASWNNVTGGKYTDLYQTPEYCDNEQLYRHFAYCQSAPTHMRYCKGNVRYACAEYIHPHLRDPYNYNLACQRMIRRTIANPHRQFFVQPYCSYCEALAKYFVNEKGQKPMPECNFEHQLVRCGPGYCEFKNISQPVVQET